jgi:hypothetical protein
MLREMCRNFADTELVRVCSLIQFLEPVFVRDVLAASEILKLMAGTQSGGMGQKPHIPC